MNYEWDIQEDKHGIIIDIDDRVMHRFHKQQHHLGVSQAQGHSGFCDNFLGTVMINNKP